MQESSDILNYGLSIGTNERLQNAYIGKAYICRDEPIGLSIDSKDNLKPYGYFDSLYDSELDYLTINPLCNCEWVEKKDGEHVDGAFIFQSRSDDYYIARATRETYYVGKVHLNDNVLTYRRNNLTEVNTSILEVLNCNCSRSQYKWKLWRPKRSILSEAVFSGYEYQKVVVGKAQFCREEPVEILVTNSSHHAFNFPKGSRRFDFSEEVFEFYAAESSCTYSWIQANRQNIDDFHAYLRQNAPRVDSNEPDSLYFGRTYFNNTYHFGKYSIAKKNFYFTLFGNERHTREFEILICEVSYEDVKIIQKQNDNLTKKNRRLSEEVKILKRNSRSTTC